jgi:predicted permease
MEAVVKSLKHAARRLRKAPVFTVTAAATLSLGIAANTAIFSVVKGVLLEPLPFRDSGELVSLWFTAPGLGFDLLNASPATYMTDRAETRVLEDVAIWDDGSAQVLVGTESEEVGTLRVTDGFLPILGVEPVIGRGFTKEDDAPGAPEVVILTHRYWQSAFGGDPDIVGKSLVVYGGPEEIIGVLPEGFEFLDQDPAYLYPARFDPAETFVGNFSYGSIGRMRPGVTVEDVTAEAESLLPVAIERFPGPVTTAVAEQARLHPLTRPLKDDLVGDVRGVLWILLGTVGIVLLIAVANVSNLFLVRAEGRVTDVAVRTAMGAERGAIAAHFLSESVLLGLLGGVLGLGLAWLGLRALPSMASDLPRIDEIGIDPVVLAFTFVVSVGAGVAFGLFPLLHYGRPNLVTSLKEGGRGGSEGRARHRARNALVVVQVAMALVLVVASGLMIRSFVAMRGVEPGFRTDDALTFVVTIPSSVTSDREATMAMWRQMMDGLESIPGVSDVASVRGRPLSGWQSNDPIFVEGRPSVEGEIPPVRRFNWAMPGYFEAMHIPLIAGRAVEWGDVDELRDVAVLSEEAARELFGGADAALGQRIATLAIDDGPLVWHEVVGVVGSVHEDGFAEDVTAAVYWPIAQHDLYGLDETDYQRTMGFVVFAEPGVMPGLLEASRRAVAEVSASLPIAQPRTMQELVDASLARTSFAMVMLGIAGAVALLLGAIGIYGVISYAVSQRRREIGLRIALGAERGHVSGMVVRQGLALTALGVVLGLAAALALTRLMTSLLFGVDPIDLPTFAAVSASLACVALLASWLPADRATRVDPATALRED